MGTSHPALVSSQSLPASALALGQTYTLQKLAVHLLALQADSSRIPAGCETRRFCRTPLTLSLRLCPQSQPALSQTARCKLLEPEPSLGTQNLLFHLAPLVCWASLKVSRTPSVPTLSSAPPQPALLCPYPISLLNQYRLRPRVKMRALPLIRLRFYCASKLSCLLTPLGWAAK